MAQIEDGTRIDYVQDWAAPLPQVLTAQQGGTTAKYLRGLGLIGEQQGSGAAAWQYYLPDALGSVRQVTDPQGQVTLSRRYDPFGGIQSSSGLSQSAYGFAGEEQDPDSEQVFLRARTYSPETGRFLQQDSVLGSPNDPRTLHRYSYGFNNPVNFTDPSGLMPPGQGRSSGRSGGGGGVAQLVPPSGYASSAGTQRVTTFGGGRGGYNQRYGTGFAVETRRSANNANHQTFSDPTARQQSRSGHGPQACGFLDIVSGFVHAGLNGGLLSTLADFAINLPTYSNTWVNLQALQARAQAAQNPSQSPPVMKGSPVWGLDTMLDLIPWESVGEWLGDQVQQTWDTFNQMFITGDWKPLLSLTFGLSMMMIAAGVTAAFAGAAIPVVIGVGIVAGLGTTAASTMFDAWINDDWDNLGANFAGGGVETALGMVGGAIGGKKGWMVGTFIGAGLGQITTNWFSGQKWDQGLLASMVFSGVADGIGGAVGHGLGSKLNGKVRDSSLFGGLFGKSGGSSGRASPLGRLWDRVRGRAPLDSATASRLNNLADSPGGNQARSRGDNLRQRLANGSDHGGLSRRINDRKRIRAEEKLRRNLAESKTAREASGFRKWSENTDKEFLYHGTSDTAVEQIRNEGFRAVGGGDFETGFYVTPRQAEAIHWATRPAKKREGSPRVISIDIPRKQWDALRRRSPQVEEPSRRLALTEPAEIELFKAVHVDGLAGHPNLSYDYIYGNVNFQPDFEQVVFKSQEAFELLNSLPISIYEVLPDGTLRLIEQISP